MPLAFFSTSISFVSFELFANEDLESMWAGAARSVHGARATEIGRQIIRGVAQSTWNTKIMVRAVGCRSSSIARFGNAAAARSHPQKFRYSPVLISGSWFRASTGPKPVPLHFSVVFLSTLPPFFTPSHTHTLTPFVGGGLYSRFAAFGCQFLLESSAMDFFPFDAMLKNR